ncbi:Hypothetical_protein [Hexamita inflata]|uniref:Hypothetical_protein n=1 Tax=Hexamita inflata TaxID=28002 RepID=A0AA86TRZ6_9EUKA|nr:Hypothetical protein HINF_LOCUS13785 [Hexamita inflata]
MINIRVSELCVEWTYLIGISKSFILFILTFNAFYFYILFNYSFQLSNQSTYYCQRKMLVLLSLEQFLHILRITQFRISLNKLAYNDVHLTSQLSLDKECIVLQFAADRESTRTRPVFLRS